MHLQENILSCVFALLWTLTWINVIWKEWTDGSADYFYISYIIGLKMYSHEWFNWLNNLLYTKLEQRN